MKLSKKEIIKEFTKLLNEWSELNGLDIKFVGASDIERFLTKALNKTRKDTLEEVVHELQMLRHPYGESVDKYIGKLLQSLKENK